MFYSTPDFATVNITVTVFLGLIMMNEKEENMVSTVEDKRLMVSNFFFKSKILPKNLLVTFCKFTEKNWERFFGENFFTPNDIVKRKGSF